MTKKVLKTVIQLRRDTAQNWLSNKNVIPYAGEPCLETDTGLVKYGDGVTTWENLPYSNSNTSSSAAYTIEKVAASSAEFASSYKLMKDGVQAGTTIDIPKDYLVQSCEVKVVEAADTPLAGYQVGDKYLDFVVNISGDSGNVKHIYLLVSELVTTYTVQANASQVQLVISESNVISASIVPKSVGESELSDTVLAKLNRSHENVLEAIQIGGVALPITDKTVELPAATAAALGLVKGSTVENGIAVATDGTMSVNDINVNKLVQTAGDELVLDGGASM